MTEEEIKEEESPPLPVKIINQVTKELTPFDEQDSDEYIDINVTDAELEQYEKENA